MLTNIRSPRAGREKGNVTLEIAIVLPLLLLITAGIIDLGILFWEKEVLTNASREGARAGARAGIDGKPRIRPEDTVDTTVEAVRKIVQDYVGKFNLRDDQGASIQLVAGTNFFYQRDAASPANIWVELKDIPVKMMLLPNIGKLFSGTFDNIVNLDAKTTMTAEWDNAYAPIPPAS